MAAAPENVYYEQSLEAMTLLKTMNGVTETADPTRGERVIDPSYVSQRVASYPGLGDQFDAMWKQLLADRVAGKVLDVETDTMLDTIQQVKADYPKPV